MHQMFERNGLKAPFVPTVDGLLNFEVIGDLLLRQIGIFAHISKPLEIHANHSQRKTFQYY